MKIKVFFILVISFLFIYAVIPDNRITIYMIGDSIMADKPANSYPLTGWGQVFGEYFNNKVIVDNRAKDGRTTKDFIAENRWQPIVDSLKAGDYVFIEFGHNDEKMDIPKIGVPLADYSNYLIRFVKEAKAKKAIPVLLTPVMRRSFTDGVFHDTHGVYADAVRNVAKEYNVPIIDLQRKSEKILIKMGDESSKSLYNWADSGIYKRFPKGSKDNTHFNITGAHKIAELAVEGIRELHLPVERYLK